MWISRRKYNQMKDTNSKLVHLVEKAEVRIYELKTELRRAKEPVKEYWFEFFLKNGTFSSRVVEATSRSEAFHKVIEDFYKASEHCYTADDICWIYYRGETEVK